MLNHWSTGNPGWSGGPPAQDAVLTLSYVKAYFNSSNATRENEWRGACAGESDWNGRTCQIPDFPSQGIDPRSTVNSGKTMFFMYENGNFNQTIYLAASSASLLVYTSRMWPVLGWMLTFSLFVL